MLASILQAHPSIHSVLFDLPYVVAGAPLLLEAVGVADPCQIVGGIPSRTFPLATRPTCSRG
jgi:hypothetical protein